MQQIEIIQPAIIVPLGRIATTFLLAQFGLSAQGKTLSDLHGSVLEAEGSFGRVTIIPMYHPAATFYNRELESTVEDDFRKLKQFL